MLYRSAWRRRARQDGATASRWRRLLVSDDGQDLAEYGIALAVIGVAASVAAVAIAADVGTLWNTASSIIDATP